MEYRPSPQSTVHRSLAWSARTPERVALSSADEEPGRHEHEVGSTAERGWTHGRR
jgi:hypothetical protein